MIPRTVPTWQGQTWQEQLIDLVRDPAELCRLLDLERDDFHRRHAPAMAQAGALFPLKVPRSLIARMEPGNPDDPLLLQVLPRAEELLASPGYGVDPLAEQTAGTPGIIQKYRSRVLLLVTGACAVHCRYCFRRHFPYTDHRRSRAQWDQALAAVAADPAIDEVILSGGDPLAAPDRLLAWLVRRIERIPHVTTLRIHTRLPIVIPDRIDRALLDWLGATRLKRVVVVHSNHPREVDRDVTAAMARLRQADAVLLNQAVLLKGVNDNADTLVTLSHRLFDAGVLPYYLHLPDKVAGTAHFDLREGEALALHRAIKARLPGYLVPKLVREVPGDEAKRVLG